MPRHRGHGGHGKLRPRHGQLQRHEHLYRRPRPGLHLPAWTGACAGKGASCALTGIQANQSSAASFSQLRYTLATAVSPTGAGVVGCTVNPVAHGGSSSCTATANSGYVFQAWSGDCTGTSCGFTQVTADKSIVALFSEAPGEEDLLIEDPEISGEKSYTATGTITVSGSVTVLSGARLILNAGERIIFNPGFRVQAGGRLSARISPSHYDPKVTMRYAHLSP